MGFCISVLIPTYKPGWYFERCLNSLESQTLDKASFKVYFALNGSGERYERYMFELLSKYRFSYEYFRLEEAGVSAARNYLLEMSREEYVTFVDDDDVLSPEYLEELLLVASKDKISVSNVFNFDSSLDELKESYIGRSYSAIGDSETSLFKSRKFFSSPVCKLIHRSVIGKTRFNTKLKVGEDSLFMAEISKKVKGINKASSAACYYVYEREGSASRTKVARYEEVKRVSYLVFLYGLMLFKGYNFLFVLSRVFASLLHLRRVF